MSSGSAPGSRRGRYQRSSTVSVTQLLSDSCSSLLQRLAGRVRGPSATSDAALASTRTRLQRKYGTPRRQSPSLAAAPQQAPDTNNAPAASGAAAPASPAGSRHSDHYSSQARKQAREPELGSTRSRLEDKYSAILGRDREKRSKSPHGSATSTLLAGPHHNPLAKSATTSVVLSEKAYPYVSAMSPREKTPYRGSRYSDRYRISGRSGLRAVDRRGDRSTDRTASSRYGDYLSDRYRDLYGDRYYDPICDRYGGLYGDRYAELYGERYGDLYGDRYTDRRERRKSGHGETPRRLSSAALGSSRLRLYQVDIDEPVAGTTPVASPVSSPKVTTPLAASSPPGSSTPVRSVPQGSSQPAKGAHTKSRAPADDRPSPATAQREAKRKEIEALILKYTTNPAAPESAASPSSATSTATTTTTTSSAAAAGGGGDAGASAAAAPSSAPTSALAKCQQKYSSLLHRSMVGPVTSASSYSLSKYPFVRNSGVAWRGVCVVRARRG